MAPARTAQVADLRSLKKQHDFLSNLVAGGTGNGHADVADLSTRLADDDASRRATFENVGDAYFVMSPDEFARGTPVGPAADDCPVNDQFRFRRQLFKRQPGYKGGLGRDKAE